MVTLLFAAVLCEFYFVFLSLCLYVPWSCSLLTLRHVNLESGYYITGITYPFGMCRCAEKDSINTRKNNHKKCIFHLCHSGKISTELLQTVCSSCQLHQTGQVSALWVIVLERVTCHRREAMPTLALCYAPRRSRYCVTTPSFHSPTTLIMPTSAINATVSIPKIGGVEKYCTISAHHSEVPKNRVLGWERVVVRSTTVRCGDVWWRTAPDGPGCYRRPEQPYRLLSIDGRP